MDLIDRDAIRKGFVGQEDGHIYFFYRPKGIEAKGPEDVSNILFIMHPFDSKNYRLISLDSPQFPSLDARFNMITGYVMNVDSKQNIILDELNRKVEVVDGSARISQESSRPCGEGVYTIVSHNDQAHLVYILEIPRNDGKVKNELHIDDEGVFLFGIYNPYYESSESQLSPSLSLPENLKALLNNDRIIYDHIPVFLNYAGIKFALFRLPADSLMSVKKQIGSLPDTEKTADILHDLKLQKENFPTEPMFKGKWK